MFAQLEEGQANRKRPNEYQGWTCGRPRGSPIGLRAGLFARVNPGPLVRSARGRNTDPVTTRFERRPNNAHRLESRIQMLARREDVKQEPLRRDEIPFLYRCRPKLAPCGRQQRLGQRLVRRYWPSSP